MSAQGGTVTLVRIDSGETMEADPYRLIGVGPPDGWEVLDDVPKERLLRRIRELLA